MDKNEGIFNWVSIVVTVFFAVVTLIINTYGKDIETLEQKVTDLEKLAAVQETYNESQTKRLDDMSAIIKEAFVHTDGFKKN